MPRPNHPLVQEFLDAWVHPTGFSGPGVEFRMRMTARCLPVWNGATARAVKGGEADQRATGDEWKMERALAGYALEGPQMSIKQMSTQLLSVSPRAAGALHRPPADARASDLGRGQARPAQCRRPAPRGPHPARGRADGERARPMPRTTSPTSASPPCSRTSIPSPAPPRTTSWRPSRAWASPPPSRRWTTRSSAIR